MVVECPYSKTCPDFNKFCDSCKHNEKRTHYEPIIISIDPIPYQPIPYYPYSPWITWTVPDTSAGRLCC